MAAEDDSPHVTSWKQPGALQQIMSWPMHTVAETAVVGNSGAWEEFLNATEEVAFHPDSPTAQQNLNDAGIAVNNLRIARQVFQSGGSHF